MAKIVLENGVVIEGTVEELTQLADKLSVKQLESQYRKVTDREPRVGDYVKFSPHFVRYDVDLSEGKFYEIIALEGDGRIRFYDDVGYARKKQPEAEGIEIYEKVGAEPEPLKVGDYAKIINNSYHTLGGFEVGDIVEIVRSPYGEDDEDFQVKRLSDGHTGYAHKTRNLLVKATDEEVTQAKAVAKWAKIGRKPNEFKKGDIVRYVSDGEICEVINVEKGITKVKTRDHGILREDGPEIELIAPVESRFDIDEDAE